MKTILRVFDALTNALAVIACIAVVGLMLHVTADVVMRALFNAPLTGTIIFVSNYYMVVAVCLPLALIERRDAHISVEVVTELLPLGPRRHLYAWTLLISLAVFGIVAWGTWQEALVQMRIDKFQIEGGMRFTTWYGYFAVPTGYGLAAVWMLLKFIRYLLGQDTPANGPEPEQVLYD